MYSRNEYAAEEFNFLFKLSIHTGSKYLAVPAHLTCASLECFLTACWCGMKMPSTTLCVQPDPVLMWRSCLWQTESAS